MANAEEDKDKKMDAELKAKSAHPAEPKGTHVNFACWRGAYLFEELI